MALMSVADALELVLADLLPLPPEPVYFCGGTLIARRWVLTAAHCTYEDTPQGRQLVPTAMAAEAMDVYLGSHDFTHGERIAVKRIVRHEDYDPTGQDNDLALLEIAAEPSSTTDVELSRVIAPNNTAALEPGQSATVVGWGSTAAGIIPVSARQAVQKLQYADGLQLSAPEECNDHYVRDRRTQATAFLKGLGKSDSEVRAVIDRWYPLDLRLISDNMLCAGIDNGSMDACFGDSGGPLIVVSGGTWQAGIVSWGPSSGCGLTGLFGVYTKISNYTGWIAAHVVAQSDPAAGCLPKQLPGGALAPPDWCDPGRRQEIPPIPSQETPAPAFRVCVTPKGNCQVPASGRPSESCWCPLENNGTVAGTVE